MNQEQKEYTGEFTGITYNMLKPYEIAEIVGATLITYNVDKCFGSLLFHNGKEVILIKNENKYFLDDEKNPTFTNNLYQLKIVYSPVPSKLTYKKEPQKLTLEDVLNLKPEDIIYFNNGDYKTSTKVVFLGLTTKWYDNIPTNDSHYILIKYKNSLNKNGFSLAYLTDQGIIPYSKDIFNKINSITLEPIYEIR